MVTEPLHFLKIQNNNYDVTHNIKTLICEEYKEKYVPM